MGVCQLWMTSYEWDLNPSEAIIALVSLDWKSVKVVSVDREGVGFMRSEGDTGNYAS